MIDIYDEYGYIKNILRDGFSNKWERDAILLVRYYKIEGKKKSEVKKLILEKCEQAANRRDNPISYNHITSFARTNKIIDKAWKKEVSLRQIKEVKFPKEVLDWFLNLEENFIITDEEVEDIKRRRPKVSIKNNKPMNFNRIKYLFTLFIWTKIQENYLDKPYMHYLKQYGKRFKEDADLRPSFNLQQERNLMFDLKFIDVNYALGINTIFMNQEVFNTQMTEDNTITISGDDLYKCGYWLEKQRNGFFVCQNCGKEFANKSKKSKIGRKNKYCEECALKLYDSKSGAHKGQAKKVPRYCVDCGSEIVIFNDNDFKTCRCATCQSKRNYESQKRYKERVKQKQKEMLQDTEQNREKFSREFSMDFDSSNDNSNDNLNNLQMEN